MEAKMGEYEIVYVSVLVSGLVCLWLMRVYEAIVEKRFRIEGPWDWFWVFLCLVIWPITLAAMIGALIGWIVYTLIPRAIAEFIRRAKRWSFH